VTLARRIFSVVFPLYLVLALAGSVVTYVIAGAINVAQARSYLSAVVQYNAESIDKSLLKLVELLIYPAYQPGLYERIFTPDVGSLSEARRILLRRDIEDLFTRNTYVPLRTSFPTATYVFGVTDSAPAAPLFDGDGDPVTRESRIAGETWFPATDDITVTPDPGANVLWYARRIRVLAGNARHDIGVLALRVNVTDLTSAQRDHPVTEGSLFYLRTRSGVLLTLTPGGPGLDRRLLSGVRYRNDHSPALDVRSRGVRYLMQPVRLKSSDELICMIPWSSIDRNLGVLLALIATVGAVLIGALYLVSRGYVARVIASPIARLAQAMTRVASHGDFGASLPADDSFDELAALYDAYNRQLRHIDELIRRIRIESERSTRSEILALQAQINPHFFSNTLDSIGWSLGDGYGDVSEALSSLSRILRYGVSDPESEVRPAEEIEIVRRYLAIQQFCYSLRIELAVEGDALERCRLPKLTLQPLVENAVLHGIREVEGLKARISIEGRVVRDRAEIRVSSNGKTPDISELERLLASDETGGKHGIVNVHRRLRMRYGEGCGLSFSVPAGGGLCVVVRVPLQPTEPGPGAAAASTAPVIDGGMPT
jgi:hypothetical protein